ncbi:MAG: DUF6805 domain-containing protein, partial [Flavobacterium sp.]
QTVLLMKNAKIHSLCEAVADITYIAAEKKYRTDDSRAMIGQFIEWAEDFEISINGKIQKIEAKPSTYLVLNRKWKSGDRISVIFKTSTHLENLPDGSNWSAFVNGPIVLAAKTSNKDLDGLFADDSRMGHVASGKYYPLDQAYEMIGEKSAYIAKLKELGNLHFRLDSLELQPFFEIHDARYQMYFQNYTEEQYKEKHELLKQQEIEAMTLEAKTIDKINCGEQQSEVDHGYKGEKSDSGYEDTKSWRSTRSYISYQLLNKNKEGKFLDIRCIEDFKTDKITILINDKPASIISSANKTIRLNVEKIEIVNVKIRSSDGNNSPKFHQFRILKD